MVTGPVNQQILVWSVREARQHVVHHVTVHTKWATTYMGVQIVF